MKHDDLDRITLLAFRHELVESGQSRLARARARLVYGDTAARRSVGFQRWLAPAGSVAAVAVVAIGSITVLNYGDDNRAPAQIGSAPNATASRKSAVLPPTAGSTSTDSPIGPTPGRASDAEHAAAVAAVDRVAGLSSGEPLNVPSGQFLYVSSTTDGGGELYRHEMWLDVNGFIALMIRLTDGSQVSVLPDARDPKDTMEQDIAQNRADFAATGPSGRFPTPAFLTGLPTDPQQMLARLRDMFAPYPSDSWSLDFGVWDQTFSALNSIEPMLTPQVREALLRALVTLPGAGSSGDFTYRGRKYVSIWFTEAGQRHSTLLIDAQTGRIAGTVDDTGVTLWHHAPVSSLGQVG